MSPTQRHLVFTSAGDRAGVHRWLEGRRNFDLWITYYGDEAGRYADLTPFYTERKGGKFSNLWHLYQEHPEFVRSYDAVWVADDDVVIDGDALSRLFELRAARDLWLLQPAFDYYGRVTYPLTGRHMTTELRYTNFVEMTCPMFRQDKLAEFLAVFDPALAGWGADEWFCQVLGQQQRDRVAVVDAIPCRNPHHHVSKGGSREINQLMPTAQRRRQWEELAARLGLEAYLDKVQFSAVRDGFPARQAASVLCSRIAHLLRWAWWLPPRALRKLRDGGSDEWI